MSDTYVLAFYEMDMAYGGPEEGGWWFNTGQLVRVSKTFKNEDRAIHFQCVCNDWFAKLGENKRPVSSVAYDGGQYIAK